MLAQIIKKKFIEVNNTLISYQEYGEGEPIILIHGLGTSCESWSKNILELSQCGKVYALDMPGFGDSTDSDEVLNSEEMAKAVSKWCKVMNIRKATFVGHSFGGEVCLWIAVKHHKLVKSLVLAASTGFNDNISLSNHLQNLMVDGLKEPIFFLPKLFKSYLKAGPRKIFLTIQKSRKKNVLNYLEKIKAPTMVVYGSHDPVIIYEETINNVRKISNVNIEIINSTHGVIFEAPDNFNQAVCKFLSRLNKNKVRKVNGLQLKQSLSV